MEDKCKTGRVTIPTDLDVVPETLEILKKCKRISFLRVMSCSSINLELLRVLF